MNIADASLGVANSDPVAVICLQDGIFIDGNEALSRLTGHAGGELFGRAVDELVVWLDPNSPIRIFFGPLGRNEAVSNLPVALRSRSWKLWVARISALRVEIEGRAHALCTVRGARPPTRMERQLAAYLELGRIADQLAVRPDAAAKALEAVCQCLDWQAGAVWAVDSTAEALHCVAVRHNQSPGLETLEAASWQGSYRPGEPPLGRIWRSGRPEWVVDVGDDPSFGLGSVPASAGVRGWFAWPALANDRVVGVVELFSREARPRDDELLELVVPLGSQFGRLLDVSAAAEAPFPPGKGQLEPRASGITDDQPALLRELAASVGRLNGLLEDLFAMDRLEHDLPPIQREGAGWRGGEATDQSVRRPVGLTLKAVSERTGIPAGTVRTWERRYGFINPVRSASGYRLYQEKDISRILTVKRLLSEGVRIREAVAAVGALDDRETAPRPMAVEF
ncbi:MAG TPA: MerR family transcriptional regulator [Actinomycetes bacterium]|nr:MerR family transcriptional regulator [Actinomycetes bacterium]